MLLLQKNQRLYLCFSIEIYCVYLDNIIYRNKHREGLYIFIRQMRSFVHKLCILNTLILLSG